MQKQKLLFSVLAALIIGLAVFVRFWQLGTIPPGLQYDEAYNGINTLQAIETNTYKVFYPENFGREGFHLNVESIFVRLLGANNFALRFTNAMWGSLTVVGFFLLLRQLRLSPLSILMGTFMMAFSFWHLNFSRTAYRAIMVPLVLSWMSYFFLKAWHEKVRPKQYLYFALSGMMVGLGFHTYIAFRVAPLIIVVLAVGLFLGEKNYKEAIRVYWKSAILFLFTTLLVVAPLAYYFYNHRGDLTGRSNAVSVFNAPNMSFPQALGKSLGAHIGAFYLSGDKNQRHNYNGQPQIPPAWSVLLTLGFIISIKEIVHTLTLFIRSHRKKNAASKTASFQPTRLFYPSLLGQSMFWVMLIPGVLSIEGIPHALRIIGAIPAVFLLCALPFEYVHELYHRVQRSGTMPQKPWRWAILRLSVIGIVSIILINGATQMYTYFKLWSIDPKTQGAFERKLYDLGLLIKQLPPRQNNFLITSYNISVSQDHKQSSLKTTEFIGYPNIKQYQLFQSIDGKDKIECTNALVVFQDADKWLRDQYKFHCPNLKKSQIIIPQGGRYGFWVLSE